MNAFKVYCTAPWTGLTIREDGIVRTCCSGQVELADLSKDNIRGVESSEVLRAIRHKMQQGKPDELNCKQCIEDETQSGFSSLRNYFNSQFPITNTDTATLNHLDIRWSNHCNLACMYCDPVFSSTWAARTAQSIPRNVKNYQDDLLEWILEHVDQVKELVLVGGEPLLMKQNYQLLKKLPENCRISIITNMSYNLEQLPCFNDLTRRPPDKIIWNVSLENIKEQFEYVRTGGSWAQILSNFETLIKHWPNSIGINMVYSLFSAFTLRETVQELHNLGVKKFNLIPIIAQPAFDVYNMPPEIKRQALMHLKETVEWHTNSLIPEDRNFYPFVGSEQLIQFLEKTQNTPAKVTKEQVLNQIKNFDRWCTRSFAEHWPNVFDLLNLHL